ncbi:MAG: hypothetical protein GY869_30590 [Planctomycetes bacterium]|nr:hypothetical protein [Planctomycetota bacterium]
MNQNPAGGQVDMMFLNRRINDLHARQESLIGRVDKLERSMLGKIVGLERAVRMLGAKLMTPNNSNLAPEENAEGGTDEKGTDQASEDLFVD